MGIGNIGWTEFVVILAFALIFFGPRRLPGIAQSIGKTLREFQKALNEVKREVSQADQQASNVKSYVKNILPPSPLADASASQADIPEDSEPELTGEAEVTVTPRAPTEPTPQTPAPDGDSEETEAEDGDAKGNDVE